MNDRIASERPCFGCGSAVNIVTSLCTVCGGLNICPQLGPQETFLASDADIAVFGGSTGSGKTVALLLDWFRNWETPGANGLIVRNRDIDITIGGGLWDEAVKLFQRSDTGAHPRGGSGTRDVTWPSSAKLSFRHLDDRNAERFKGPGFSWIGIEEANECPIDAIIYLLSRLRSNCGAKPRLRLTLNPDPDHELAEWVEWYLAPDGTSDRAKSGIVRWMLRSAETGKFVFAESAEAVADLAGGDPRDAMTFAYVPSLLSDNPALDLGDPSYRSKIANMDPVQKARLGDGNWKIRAETGGMFRREWWGGPVSEPLAPIVRRIRSWDRAGSVPSKDYPDPDFSVGVLVLWDVQGRWYVADVVACRGEPPEVDMLMEETAERDGPDVTQVVQIDPAQAGKVERLHTAKVLGRSGVCGPIVAIKPVEAKEIRAKPLSDELRLGMTGKNGERVPRGYVLDNGLDNGWMAMPYSDGGPSPKTMGGLFWGMMLAFFNPSKKKKKDIPDALVGAYEVGGRPKPVKPLSPRERLELLKR